VPARQPVKVVKRVALVPLLLDPPAVFNIAVSADFREIDELICRSREIEDLTKFYCADR
jgi:hypothetical protein